MVASPEDIAALIGRMSRLDDAVAEAVEEDEDERRRRHRDPRVGRRRAGHQARQLDHRPGGRGAARPTSTSSPTAATCACASASTACCARRTHDPAPDGRRRGLAREDHGRPRHRRAARPAGRPRVADRRRARDRHPRRHDAARLRRGHRHAHPRQGAGADRARHARHVGGLRGASRRASASPTAPCSSPARPARASRRRSTRALNAINAPEKNIITIEDPVEYQLAGRQPDPGQPEGGARPSPAACARCCAPTPTSSWSARSATRETAQIAVESALTGHLVLSTLHTNDAPSAITRLTEMGIEPFLTASAVCTRRRPAARAPALHALQAARPC